MVRESNNGKVNVDMAVIQTNMVNLKKDQEQNRIDNAVEHKDIKDILNKFIDRVDMQRELDLKSNDDKYASKKIETAFWWTVSVVGSILITSLMYLIIK
jgi:hypothetical protein